MFLIRFALCPLGVLHFFHGESWDQPLLQAGQCSTRNRGVSYFGHFPYLKCVALSGWVFLKPGGGGVRQPQPFKDGRPVGIFGVLPSH